MRVTFRHPRILVAEKLRYRDRVKVNPSLSEVACEGVPQIMEVKIHDVCLLERSAEGPLDPAVIELLAVFMEDML